MELPEIIRVRVVYALPERQCTVDLRVAAGTSVAEAVAGSGIAAQFPDIAAQSLNCAIFGRVVTLGQTLCDGDRIEILRPLIADPKQNRRQAAARDARFKPRK